jgi:hypothetical protein
MLVGLRRSLVGYALHRTAGQPTARFLSFLRLVAAWITVEFCASCTSIQALPVRFDCDISSHQDCVRHLQRVDAAALVGCRRQPRRVARFSAPAPAAHRPAICAAFALSPACELAGHRECRSRRDHPMVAFRPVRRLDGAAAGQSSSLTTRSSGRADRGDGPSWFVMLSSTRGQLVRRHAPQETSR